MANEPTQPTQPIDPMLGGRIDLEYERKQRDYERRRRQEPLMFMAAIISSGMSGNQDMSEDQIENRALKIAQGLMRKVESLP